MRNGLIAFLIILCMFCLSGCADSPSSADLAFEITTVEDSNTYAGKINFPIFVSRSSDYSMVNQLVENTVYEHLNELSEDVDANVSIQLNYSITLQSNKLVCILFEGVLSSEFAAHDTNFAFSVCISPEENARIDPKTLFEPSAQWLNSFREQVKKNQNPERFNDEQWEMVTEYIQGFSDEEIVTILCKDFSKTVVFLEDGIVVLFPVPYALGDYVKIVVPNN